MKFVLFLTLSLATHSLYARESFFGNYTLNSGDNCSSEISIINVTRFLNEKAYTGIRFIETSKIGSYFEEEASDDFLNINQGEYKFDVVNRSHGQKYKISALTNMSNPESKNQYLTKIESTFTTFMGLKVYESKVRSEIAQLGNNKIVYVKDNLGMDGNKIECYYIKN